LIRADLHSIGAGSRFLRMSGLRLGRPSNQRYRASGLNLVVTAIILWSTVYLERAVQSLRDSGQEKAIHKPHLLTAEPVFYSGAIGVQFHGSSAS